MPINENELRNMLSTEGGDSLFEVVLDSFVDFFETENAAVYCIMEGRCYSLYKIFKPFIEKKVDLAGKKIITDKTFLCVADRVQGLLAGGKKLVILDSCVYVPEHFNDFISGSGVNSEDIILKSILVYDNIAGLNIFANKCEIGKMRDYSDHFWAVIMVCGAGGTIISVDPKHLMNFAKTIEVFSGYKFKLENSGFVVREMPCNPFRELIAEKSDIRYFCAVPEKPFGIEINNPENLEKAKFMRSICISYDNGVFRFYPFVTLNIAENRGEIVELYEKNYGEYFPLPDTNLYSKAKLVLERMGFLSGIELSIKFLKAVFNSEDINSFKDFCKIENADILFNEFLVENHILNLVFYDNLPKTGGVYDKLQIKNLQVENQKTLGDYFVEEFITDEDIERYYWGYDRNELVDFTAFWENEIDSMVDSLKANENEKHLPTTSIFECLKTFFSEKAKDSEEIMKHFDAVVAAVCFSNECCTLMIGTNGVAHIGEGAAFVASRDFPYLAQTADKFSKTLKNDYEKNLKNLEIMFLCLYQSFVSGQFDMKSIRHILIAAKDDKSTFKFSRNADLSMDFEVKEMLDNLSANAKKFSDFCNGEKSPMDFVEYAFGISQNVFDF